MRDTEIVRLHKENAKLEAERSSLASLAERLNVKCRGLEQERDALKTENAVLRELAGSWRMLTTCLKRPARAWVRRAER